MNVYIVMGMGETTSDIIKVFKNKIDAERFKENFEVYESLYPDWPENDSEESKKQFDINFQKWSDNHPAGHEYDFCYILEKEAF